MTKDRIQTVAIVGVGLIGGSFGLALRKVGFRGTILGVSSARSIAEASERGAIDEGVDLKEAAARSELLLLAQPISGIIQTLKELGALLVGRGALVTDVGSTKVAIERAAKAHLRDSCFLGGHPMAGKEVRGAGAADPDLFRGRPWILTSQRTDAVALEFRAYIEEFGAQPVPLTPEEHDRLVAWASHVPQLVSTLLAGAIAQHEPGAARVAGPGLLDMTRLAMSSYDLWGDILNTNRTEIAAALKTFADVISSGEDYETAFERGAAFAKHLRKT